MPAKDKDTGASAHKVRRLAHLDVPGAGQVTIAGHHAYVGHIPNPDQLGTTIIDIADPYRPRVVATVRLDDPALAKAVNCAVVKSRESEGFILVWSRDIRKGKAG